MLPIWMANKHCIFKWDFDDVHRLAMGQGLHPETHIQLVGQ